MTAHDQDLREPILLDASQDTESTSKEGPAVGKTVLLVLGILLILGAIGTGLYFLFQPGTDTARVRDIFIIFLALEFLLIGIALIILIIQLARLTLMLQNEIGPILDSTNQTANTLRGTALFLSDHLVEPVLKLNTYLAGLNRIVQFFKTEGK